MSDNKGGDRSMTTFPLSAMVGRQKLWLALILNTIDPSIDGVLAWTQRYRQIYCHERGMHKA
ncbi:MAG: hypothetical protein NVSMB54_11560 [Ktedonobacteraceae bacterium]